MGDGMRNALVILMMGLGGCATSGLPINGATADAAGVREVLLKADRDFSALSAQQGFPAAVTAWFAEDAVELPNKENPVIGKSAILANLAAQPAPGFLSWEPRRAEASGDLGYTWGEYKLQYRENGGVAQMKTGKYVSIWKRQADGGWKVIVDIGNPGPDSPQPSQSSGGPQPQ